MAGAASLAFSTSPPGINLLPVGLRTRQRRQRRRPWLVTAGLLTLAAPLLPIWQIQLLADHARELEIRLDQELVVLRKQAAAVQREQERVEELNRARAAWLKVESGRSGWLRFLADLQERLTGMEDVWLDQLKGLPTTATSPYRIELAGRMLDRDSPLSPAGPAVLVRAKGLLEALSASPFVDAIEQERFDGSKPGVLAFRLILVIAAPEPL